MHEEDRVRTLDMYSEIFDEVANDNAALQLFVSPTRQAVNLARAYNANAGSLHGYGEEKPAYIEVIEDLRRQASDIAPVLPKVDDDQISLFEEPDVAVTVFDNLKLDTATAKEADEPNAALPERYDLYPDEDKSTEPAASVYPINEPKPEPKPESKPEPEQEVDDFSDAVEAFLRDFAIQDENAEAEPPYPTRYAEKPREPLPAREPLAPQIMDERDEDQPAPVEQRSAPPARSARQDVKLVMDDLPPLTTTKVNVPLLILFILIAVPVTLACIALLLALAASLLVLAVAALYTGFSGLVAAFTSFSVFADLLLVFGLSLSLAAVGLLLFWLFIWMLVGAIPGLVRWVCGLARKLCYKEVAI